MTANTVTIDKFIQDNIKEQKNVATHDMNITAINRIIAINRQENRKNLLRVLYIVLSATQAQGLKKDDESMTYDDFKKQNIEITNDGKQIISNGLKIREDFIENVFNELYPFVLADEIGYPERVTDGIKDFFYKKAIYLEGFKGAKPKLALVRTDEVVVVGKIKRIVYKGPRGKKYVRYQKEYITLAEFRKKKA